jgi:pimeloyl-ACP methyl ester carboxylesterase
MRFFLLSICLLMMNPAQAVSWNEYLQSKTEKVIHSRHLPYQLYHGHKTAKSVLLIHGTYSSPLYFKGMAQRFFAAGMNVVTILLPGYNEKDIKAIDKVKIEEWVQEADLGFKLAMDIGDQVLLAGHSLGGLLAIDQALKRDHQLIAGLALFAPAVKVWKAVEVAGKAGAFIGIKGNDFLRHKPDGDEIPYFGPIAAPLVQSLAKKVEFSELKHPVFLAYTSNDLVIDTLVLRKFGKILPHKKVYHYGFESRINHGDITTAPEDLATYGNKRNLDFHRMMDFALDFLN